MLKLLLAAMFLLAFTSPPTTQCSAAPPPPTGPNVAANSTYQSDGWPPARFQKNNSATVVFTDTQGITHLCGAPPCNYVILGCENEVRIVLPNPCTYPHDDAYARLACHELAHKSGWPAWHGE